MSCHNEGSPSGGSSATCPGNNGIFPGSGDRSLWATAVAVRNHGRLQHQQQPVCRVDGNSSTPSSFDKTRARIPSSPRPTTTKGSTGSWDQGPLFTVALPHQPERAPASTLAGSWGPPPCLAAPGASANALLSPPAGPWLSEGDTKTSHQCDSCTAQWGRFILESLGLLTSVTPARLRGGRPSTLTLHCSSTRRRPKWSVWAWTSWAHFSPPTRGILMTLGYFTKWPEAYVVPDQSAATTTERKWNNLPEELHIDRVRNCEAVVFSEVLPEKLGIKNCMLHPQSDC